jgi:hypothetical protein
VRALDHGECIGWRIGRARVGWTAGALRGPTVLSWAFDGRGGFMEDALLAYGAGRVDALAGVRDALKAKHPVTGADYRIGFLDGRIEIFRMFAGVRKILDTDG